jgi:D-xylose transport system permease protein
MQSRLILREFALGFALLILCAFFTLKVPGFQFVSARNLSLLMIDFSITATLAVGMLLVILPGHIDLSAGSGVGLTGGLAAVGATHQLGIGAWVITPLKWLSGWAEQLGASLKSQWPLDVAASLTQAAAATEKYFTQLFTTDPWLKAPLAMLAAVLIALILWRSMGRLIVRHRIPAFIITLGGLLIFKGLFWKVIESHTVPVGDMNTATLERINLRISEGLLAGTTSVPAFEHVGNAYASLTTSYFLPVGAWLIAAFVILCLIIVQLRARSQRLASGFATDDGEVAFLKLFVAAQLIALLSSSRTQFRGLPLSVVILAWSPSLFGCSPSTRLGGGISTRSVEMKKRR